MLNIDTLKAHDSCNWCLQSCSRALIVNVYMLCIVVCEGPQLACTLIPQIKSRDSNRSTLSSSKHAQTPFSPFLVLHSAHCPLHPSHPVTPLLSHPSSLLRIPRRPLARLLLPHRPRPAILRRDPLLDRILRHGLHQQGVREDEHVPDPAAGLPLVRSQQAQAHAALVVVRHVRVVDLGGEVERRRLEGVVRRQGQREVEVARREGRCGRAGEGDVPDVDVGGGAEGDGRGGGGEGGEVGEFLEGGEGLEWGGGDEGMGGEGGWGRTLVILLVDMVVVGSLKGFGGGFSCLSRFSRFSCLIEYADEGIISIICFIFGFVDLWR